LSVYATGPTERVLLRARRYTCPVGQWTRVLGYCQECNEMMPLLDRPITAATDDGVCRWHAAKLWQTRAKLLKLNLICIISRTANKNVLKSGLLIFQF